jgi:hypothetical protein
VKLRFDLHGSSVDDLLDARGYLAIEGVATRTGVFIYDDPNGGPGDFREWRPPEHVFAPGSIQSLKFVPITNDHPDVLLDSSNTDQFQVGMVLDAWRDGDLIRVRLLFTDAKTIQAIRDGKRELSCGYTAVVLERAGTTPQGERHDAIQTDILYNHLALVDAARAGPVACLQHLDGARIQRRIRDMQRRKYKITMTGAEQPIEILDQAEPTETVVIAGVEHVVPPAIAMVINAQAEKIVALTQEVMSLQGEQQQLQSQGVPPSEAAAQANEIESANGQLERLAAKAAGADADDEPPPNPTEDSQPMKQEDVDRIAAAAAKIVADQVSGQVQKDRADATLHSDTVARARPYLDAGYVFSAKTVAEIHADAIKAADHNLTKQVDEMLESKLDMTSLFSVICDGRRAPQRHNDTLGHGLWTHLKQDRRSERMPLIDKARACYLRRLGITSGDRAGALEAKLDAELTPNAGRQVTINLDGLVAGAKVPDGAIVVDTAGKAPARS